MWRGVKKCRYCLFDGRLTVQTQHQSLAHLRKGFQDFNDDRDVRWLGRLMQCDFTVKNIKGSTNVVADTGSRRRVNLLICAARAPACDESGFLSKMRSFHVIHNHAAASLASPNTDRHVKHCTVEADLL